MNDDEQNDRAPFMQALVQKKRGERQVITPKPDERTDWIGGGLRRLYDETVSEPIPDRLMRLLKKLEKKEGEGSPSS